jgi:glycosyltransferase involved in cell wall biosynthesis
VATELALLSRRSLVVTHHGFQATCLEGLGWHHGEWCDYRLPRCIALTRKHGGIARCARQLARYPLGRAQLHLARRNVAVSAFVARVIDAPRTSVVYNCADTSVFKPQDAPLERTRVLFLGRFVGEKGVDTLLGAVAHSWKGGNGVLLDLVGSGPLEAAYRRLVNDLGLADRVRFKGSLRGEALAEAIRSSIGVAVPSTWDEAFGIVAAEALSCGRLAIVSDRGGLPEVVEGMDTVVPEGDIPAWAAALARVANDAAWRTSQERQTAFAAARFTPERFADGYVRVYEAALGGAA